MAIIKKDGNFMGLPMNIKRSNPISLDTTELWYDLEEAQEYAAAGAVAYVGQTIKVINEAEGTVDEYNIAMDGTLVPTYVDPDTLIYEIDRTTVLNTLKPNTLIVKELPVANVSYRGYFALLDNGTDDTLYICRKKAGSYVWTKINGDGDEVGTGDGSDIIPPTSGEDVEGTTAILGIAVLGTMKLGEGA